MTATTLAIGAVGLGLAVHLLAEASGWPVARAASKAAASAALVVLGLAASTGGRYAHLVVAGLLLSAAGDVLLLSSRERAFLAGIGSFLVAHVAYAAAFAPAARVSLPVAGLLSLAAVGIVAWLWPHLGKFRIPVVVYALAITAMLVLALGVASPIVRAGALLFYLSDLTVARDRFVHRAFGNRLVGLPLYYAGQVLLALSAAGGPEA